MRITPNTKKPMITTKQTETVDAPETPKDTAKDVFEPSLKPEPFSSLSPDVMYSILGKKVVIIPGNPPTRVTFEPYTPGIREVPFQAESVKPDASLQ